MIGERLRSIIGPKKSPDFCGEPPEPGVVAWNVPIPDNPGLYQVCTTPEEKQRRYSEAQEFVKGFWSRESRIRRASLNPRTGKQPEYFI